MNENHGNTGTRLHRIWMGMRSRCKSLDKGGRKSEYTFKGITVCKEWEESYVPFREWALLNGYADNLSIDRRDNDGDYTPENCRWTTQIVQSRNTRVTYSTNRSGYRGVSWNKSYQKWEVSISIKNTTVKIGYYDTPYTAACAYDTYVRTHSLGHTTNNTIEHIEPNVGSLLITTNTSGYIGVSSPARIKHYEKCWTATVMKKRTLMFHGYYSSALEAAVHREQFIIDSGINSKRNFDDTAYLLYTQLLEERNIRSVK